MDLILMEPSVVPTTVINAIVDSGFHTNRHHQAEVIRVPLCTTLNRVKIQTPPLPPADTLTSPVLEAQEHLGVSGPIYYCYQFHSSSSLKDSELNGKLISSVQADNQKHQKLSQVGRQANGKYTN